MVKTPEEASKWELHITYSRGVRDGAGSRVMRKAYMDHQREDLRATYTRGYVLGQKLVYAAIMAHAAEIGYVPNVLRAMGAPLVDDPIHTVGSSAEIGKRYILNALGIENTPEGIEQAVRALAIGRAQIAMADVSGPPHSMAAPSGPTCGGCGCPSAYESGWCGNPTCEVAPHG